VSSDPASICIATPIDGTPETASVSVAYHSAVMQLKSVGCGIAPRDLLFSDDVVRARSRAAWYVVENTAHDWVLWIDEDVVFDPAIVPHMVTRAEAHGFDVLGAPYPRKRKGPPVFPYKPLPETLEQGGFTTVNECVEVEQIPFGFVLTSTKCLRAMFDWYREAEWFTHQNEDESLAEVVGIFNLVHSEVVIHKGQRTRNLHSEDYSFCHRWRAMGGKVWMYLGPHAPLGHIGAYVYRGQVADLGRLR
jgi:hypothetical protein